MINQWNSGDIKFLEIENADELKDLDLSPYDLVISKDELENSLKYPTKIIFEMDVPSDLEEFINSYESSKRSSIRKRIRTTNEKLDALFLDPIDEVHFKEWEEGYKHFINSLGEGHNYIDENWLKEHIDNHFAIFFTNKETGKIEGGSLIKKFQETAKLSMSFAWYSDLAKEIGASTALITKLIDFAISNNYKIISFGQDTNIYGGHLSIGLEEFKTSWRAHAKIAKAAELKYIKPVMPIKNRYKFYIVEGDNLKLFKSYE